MKRLLVVVATAALLVAPLLYGTPASAATSDRECADTAFQGSAPFASRGNATLVEITVNADCTLTVLPPRTIPVSQVPIPPSSRDQRSQSIRGRIAGDRNLPRSGADPEYHIVNQVLDPIGVNLTSIQTDLYWTSDGTVITGGNGNNTARWHVEDTCYPPDGWHLAALTGGQAGGGVGQPSASWSGHAEWWYRGFFSACDPNLYYNTFDNFVTGYANGAQPYCSYSQYAKGTFRGWRFYVYCYSPTIVLKDYTIP